MGNITFFIKIHNIFHILLLEKYYSLVFSQIFQEKQTWFRNNKMKWKLEMITDSIKDTIINLYDEIFLEKQWRKMAVASKP